MVGVDTHTHTHFQDSCDLRVVNPKATTLQANLKGFHKLDGPGVVH